MTLLAPPTSLVLPNPGQFSRRPLLAERDPAQRIANLLQNMESRDVANELASHLGAIDAGWSWVKPADRRGLITVGYGGYLLPHAFCLEANNHFPLKNLAWLQGNKTSLMARFLTIVANARAQEPYIVEVQRD